MHPIERLRAVARASDVDQAELAREAAVVLGALAGDPPGLLTSCRRLLDRHPGAGALWWVCARLLDTVDPAAEVRAIVRDLSDDTAVGELLLDVPVGARLVVTSDPAGGSVLTELLDTARDDLVVEEMEPAHTLPPAVTQASGDGGTLVVVEAGAAGQNRVLAPVGTSQVLAAARRCGIPSWLVVGTGRRLPDRLFEAVMAAAPRGEAVCIDGADRVVEARSRVCPCPPELL